MCSPGGDRRGSPRRGAAGALVLAVAVAAGGLAGCDRGPPPPPSPAPLPACTGAPLSATGDATYYDADGTGSCSFEPSADHRVVALSGPDWSRARWCGACLAVTGPRGEVIVRVVDQCPGCKHGDLDLGREAFAQIAPLSAGRARIAWREVPCPVTGPIGYRLKPGSSPHWTAIQLRNHRYAIERLEARDAGGAYRAIPRGDDNYFVASGGLGAGPYALRVADIHGHVLEDGAIALDGNTTRPGAAQLPPCP